MARLDKVRLLLGEDELVEAGQAQTVSVVAVPDMQFTVRLEQLSTVYLAIPDADLTKPMCFVPLTGSVLHLHYHIRIIPILYLLAYLLGVCAMTQLFILCNSAPLIALTMFLPLGKER
jgi:hypothetical protein